MTLFQKIAQSVLFLLLTLKGITLNGQNDIYFSYKCSDTTLRPINAEIKLISPDLKIFNLFTDTVGNYNFTEKKYFKTKGNYTLSIYFKAENYGKDSLKYDFDLKGDEIITRILLSFDYREKSIKKGDIYIKGEKILNGYISLNKYYQAPKTIEIQLDNSLTGSEFYKGPFFKIKNNSNDTFYGEHLPGYFWGTLSYIKNDSILSTSFGIPDYSFADSPPLYPHSTKYVTVGSFGLTNKLFPFEYSFVIMLSKKSQSMGIGIYEERQDFNWWAGTKEYYRLEYNFKID